MAVDDKAVIQVDTRHKSSPYIQTFIPIRWQQAVSQQENLDIGYTSKYLAVAKYVKQNSGESVEALAIPSSLDCIANGRLTMLAGA